MQEIRILIADDHPVYRFGLRSLLATEPGTQVVGEAATGEQAVALTKELKPDIVLMDVNMPGMNGIDATRQIVADCPNTGVLIITMLDDDTVFTAMRAGARGYLLKGSEGDVTLRAIRAVADGEAIFSPATAERLMEYFASSNVGKGSLAFPELTPRECEILELIAKGYTNSTIAERLVLSPKTVRNYISTIFSKLQVADRAEAIVRARQAGLGE